MTNPSRPTRDIHLSRSWYAVLALSALGFVAAIIWVSFPEIDLTLSSLFANGDGDGARRFNLRRHPVAKFLNEVIDEGGAVLVAFVILGLVITTICRRPFLRIRLRQYWFVLLSLITGPGLVANALFKENWGRARPRDVEFFGGSQTFTPPLVITDQCDTNCSFVSGDASLAFTMLALALVMPHHRKRWVIVAFLFGCLIGMTRIVQGAHFPSDTFFAGLFMGLSVLLVYMVVIEQRWGITARVEQFWQQDRLKIKAGLKALSDALGLTPVWKTLGLTARSDEMNRAVFADAETWKQRMTFFFKASLGDLTDRKKAD